MDDVISQGDDPEPGHRAGRRRLLLVVALVAVAAIIVVEHAPHGRRAHPRLISASTRLRLRRSGLEPAAPAAPDGRYLAFGVSHDDGAENGDLTTKLKVVRLGTGRIEAVPGTWVSSDATFGFGWADHDELVAELNLTTKVQLVSWSPGASRLAVASVRSGQDPVALILR